MAPHFNAMVAAAAYTTRVILMANFAADVVMKKGADASAAVKDEPSKQDTKRSLQ